MAVCLVVFVRERARGSIRRERHWVVGGGLVGVAMCWGKNGTVRRVWGQSPPQGAAVCQNESARRKLSRMKQ